VLLYCGNLVEAREEEDIQERPGNKHSRKIYRRCESVGVVLTEWPVIGVGGKVSSPNAAAGVGGSKSKCKKSPERKTYFKVDLCEVSDQLFQ